MAKDSISLLSQKFNSHLMILGQSFNRKFGRIISILVSHKTSGSLGALAGFAIAFFFAWKFSRSPISSRRQKKEMSGAVSTLDGNGIKSGDALSNTEKVSRTQMVRKKLCGGRKMTCQLLGVILEESTPEELQEHATVKSTAVEVLLEIGKVCDIYLMETVLDDDTEERVLLALEMAGLFVAGGLMKEKVLFCSTDNGRLSFVRQLEPDWHVDTDPNILSQLSKFVRNQLHISPTGSSFASQSTIFSSKSLDSYFTGGGLCYSDSSV